MAIDDVIVLAPRAEAQSPVPMTTAPDTTTPLGPDDFDAQDAELDALRETDEEAGAHIELGELFTLMNVPRVGQVHLFYRARLLSERFNPGHETIEARLFHENEIPWDEIAFRTVRETLQCYFADRRRGRFGFHVLDIV